MSSSEENKRANYILKRAHDMHVAKKKYSDKWPTYEKVWKLIADKRNGEDEWRAALPDTWCFATIKTAQAAFVDSKVVPIIIRHPDDPKSKAEDLRDLYTDVGEKGNIDEELYYTRLDAFKLGNGYLKTIYIKDERPVWDIEKFDPETGTFTYVKKTISEFDDPKSVRVSPYLVLVDDLARANNGSIRDRIEIEVLGRDEAKARYGHLIKNWDEIPQTTLLLDQLKASAATQVAETDGTGLRNTEFEVLNQYTFFAPGFDWSNDVVEVLHYWNKGIMTPSGCLDSKEILINGYPAEVDTPGKATPIPYIHKQIPFTDIKYSPYSGDEHYSAGIIEIALAEATALKQHREMMSDRQKLSLFSPAFSDVNDEIDQRQLKMKPFSIIRTKGGAPKQYTIPGITNADLLLQDRMESSLKRAVGIDERVLGVESNGPRLTATEISFLREGALKRLKEFVFLYKNALLQNEIKLKLSLFKQYYSNPLKKESKVKDDKGERVLKAEFKKFKIKGGNVYTEKEITPNYFEGEVDTDLDLNVLLPMTQAQMVTLWSQVLRDAVPFVQAGVVDISLKKVFNNYVEALGTNPDKLKEDTQAAALDMAEAEHNLFFDPNTSKDMNTILPQGTQAPYLTQEHVLKHQELLDTDTMIEDTERLRLLEHIKKDIAGLQKLQAAASTPNLSTLTPAAMAGVGGGGAIPAGATPIIPTTNTIITKNG